MPIFKKIHRLERAQYAPLDQSETLVFRDVIKTEILQVTVMRMLASLLPQHVPVETLRNRRVLFPTTAKNIPTCGKHMEMRVNL